MHGWISGQWPAAGSMWSSLSLAEDTLVVLAEAHAHSVILASMPPCSPSWIDLLYLSKWICL